MGGKNHQPCRSFLMNSTKLSRAMSMAFVNIELANVALEDVILTELEGRRAEVAPILEKIRDSDTCLQQMQAALEDLCKQMMAESFQDLPTLKQVDLATLGKQMHTEGLHQSAAEWQGVAKTMREQGFWGMTSDIGQRIAELSSLTKELHEKVQSNAVLAQQGTLYLALEENGETNFKREFARLYTKWASFQQMFLASSLVSTELWYRFNKFGSVLQSPGALQAAA